MELSRIKDNFVFFTKIDLNSEGDYIVLRELNMQEMHGLKKDDSTASTDKNIEYLVNIFKDCLVEHSFTNDGQKASKQEVYDELKQSGTLFMDIINTWLSSIPFSERLKKEKSEQSEPSSFKGSTRPKKKN